MSGSATQQQTAGPPTVQHPSATRESAPGSAFQQFVAQSILNQAYDPQADEQSELYRTAAAEVAELRGYNATSRSSFGAQAQLQKDEWITLDDNLVQVAQDELVIVDDLRASGLTINSDLSTLIHEFQSTGVFGDANVDMSPASGADEDATAFSLNGVPLPIVQKGFSLDVRTQLMPSRRTGQALDTQNQTKAARSVMEGLEDLVFNGWTSTVQGYTVYGLRGANAEPNVNTFNGSDWDDFVGNDADTIRGDILTGIEALEDDNYGPGNTGYWAYFGKDAYQALRRWDTGTDQERGLLERLQEEFGEISRWSRADALPDDEYVMFKPVEDVLQLAVASDIQNVEWENYGGWEMTMKVMASMTPIVKSDEANQSGVVNATGLLA